MSAAVIPFRRRSPGPSLADIEAQVMRETARLNAECLAALEESVRIKRDYQERQARIEKLLAHYQRQWERA